TPFPIRCSVQGHWQLHRPSSPMAEVWTSCGEKRREVSAPGRRLTKIAQHLVHSAERDLPWRRYLDPDWSAVSMKIDDEAGGCRRGAMATVPWPTREIQIRGDRAPMTIRYLQVGLAHDSTFPTDTRSRRPTGSQSQPPAPSSISRSSSSVKRRSSIRFKRCGVNSSSHSHHGGQCLLAPTVHLSLHHRGRDLL